MYQKIKYHDRKEFTHRDPKAIFFKNSVESWIPIIKDDFRNRLFCCEMTKLLSLIIFIRYGDLAKQTKLPP